MTTNNANKEQHNENLILASHIISPTNITTNQHIYHTIPYHYLDLHPPAMGQLMGATGRGRAVSMA